MGQAVPTINILGGKARRQLNFFIVENITENFCQLDINGLFVHPSIVMESSWACLNFSLKESSVEWAPIWGATACMSGFGATFEQTALAS